MLMLREGPSSSEVARRALQNEPDSTPKPVGVDSREVSCGSGAATMCHCSMAESITRWGDAWREALSRT